MSHRATLRQLKTEMRWLWREGLPREIETRLRIVDMLQQISDRVARDPAAAARWAATGRSVPLPPPRVAPPPALLVRRDVPPRDAPQDQVKKVEPPPPHPEEPREARRLEGCEPAPPNYDPPEHMQIRPVTWRLRGPQDWPDDCKHDSEDWVGRCKTEYDPLDNDDDDDA